jgi:thimet oligopeptidase
MKYYQNLRENKEFKVDQLRIQEYFPLNVVIEGTFKIYKLLLGLEIEEIQNAPSYHEELRLVRILEVFIRILTCC